MFSYLNPYYWLGYSEEVNKEEPKEEPLINKVVKRELVFITNDILQKTINNLKHIEPEQRPKYFIPKNILIQELQKKINEKKLNLL